MCQSIAIRRIHLHLTGNMMSTMGSSALVRILVAFLAFATPTLGAKVCKAAGLPCRRHKECCKLLMCSADGVCKSPGGYAKKWLKASSKRRLDFYTRKKVSTKDFAMKWSYTLAEAAQNWTDFLIQQDDCQGLNDTSCYEGTEGFMKYCQLIHEGDGVGSSDPYGGENLAAAKTLASLISSITTPEKIMQQWWDSEEKTKGGHFLTAAKMRSRYMGCGWSSKEVPNEPGFVCRITACRYMTKCGKLFERIPTLCPLCPDEGC